MFRAVRYRSPRRKTSVSVLIAPRRRRSGLLFLLTSLGLVSAASLGLGGMWLGWNLIVAPESMRWFTQHLSGWVSSGLGQDPQTLAEIEASVAQDDLELGPKVAIASPPEFGESATEFLPESQSEFLVPLLKSPANCQTNCQTIVELRVYRPVAMVPSRRPQDQRFSLMAKVPVKGPEELVAIAPLLDAHPDIAGSERILPLKKVQSLAMDPPSHPEAGEGHLVSHRTAGHWLTLTGSWKRGGKQVTYGQMVHYDARRGQLRLLSRWTSPAEKLPFWQDLNSAYPPELLVNQTVGLEPHFVAYQAVEIRGGIKLEPVSLSLPALPDSAYGDALTLARSGLWSAAARSLTQQKTPNWPAQAHVQLGLIQHHAQLTAAQADRSWSSITQQILAHLIDGRWQVAIEVMEKEAAYADVLALLKQDSGRLWDRITTTLRLNPKQPEVQAWGALLFLAQEGKPAAIAWLDQQGDRTKLKPILANRLLAAASPAQSTAGAAGADDDSSGTKTSATDADPANPVDTEVLVDPHPSYIIGTAKLVQGVNPDWWLLPRGAEPLALSSGQRWYQIQVSSFHDGDRWRNHNETSLPSSGPALWRLLGLDTQSQLRIMATTSAGASQSRWVTVQAVQVSGDFPMLLATGDPVSHSRQTPSLLAMTPELLTRFEDLSAIPLTQLNQQRSSQVAKLLPTVWQELRQAGHTAVIPAAAGNSPSNQTSGDPAVPDWPARLVDLTGDGKLDVVLTLEAAVLNPNAASVDSARLVFSADGTLLYSDLGTSRSLLAFIRAGTNQPAALVVNGPEGHQLQQWSPQAGRFN